MPVNDAETRLNREFAPIELAAEDEDAVAVVAELVEVLGAGSLAGGSAG